MTRSKLTGNFLVNALHVFQRFNRRYHVKTYVTLHLRMFDTYGVL